MADTGKQLANSQAKRSRAQGRKIIEIKPWHNQGADCPSTKRPFEKAFPGYFNRDDFTPTSPFDPPDTPPRATSSAQHSLESEIKPHPLRKRRVEQDGEAKSTHLASGSQDNIAIDIEDEGLAPFDTTHVELRDTETKEVGVRRRIQQDGQHQMPPKSDSSLPDVIIQDGQGTGYLEIPRDLLYSFPAVLGHPWEYIWDVLAEMDERAYNTGTVGSSDSDGGHYDDIALDRHYDASENAKSEQSIKQDWPLAEELDKKRQSALARIAKLHEKRLRRQETEDEENRRASFMDDEAGDGLQWCGGGAHCAQPRQSTKWQRPIRRSRDSSSPSNGNDTEPYRIVKHSPPVEHHHSLDPNDTTTARGSAEPPRELPIHGLCMLTAIAEVCRVKCSKSTVVHAHALSPEED